jgi:hypothetical protein
MKFDLNNTFERNKYDTYSDKLKLSNSKVELKKLGANRTIPLNSYLHVCIDLYAIEFGHTKNEAKTDLKRECHFMRYEKNGKHYLVETSKQTNDECSRFVEWIRNYSSQQGLYIPDAEEYKENKFSIDKEIDKHKTYL